MLKSTTMNIVDDNGLIYLTFPLFERYSVRHAFTTRHGGVSTGDCASFNTSFDRGDDPAAVTENMRRLCRSIGVDAKNLTYAKQTHTNNVRVISREDLGKGFIKPLDYTDTDGLISDIAESVLITQYADCVPLIFYDTKKGVIANSHAGWRGTAKEIGRVTVERMVSEFGSNPADIIAGIGPSIGSCCYEVDTPVYEAFEQIGYLPMDELFSEKSDGKYMLDLKRANKYILMNAGIKEENIAVSDICTNCNHSHLHSHRYTAGKRGNLGMIIAHS